MSETHLPRYPANRTPTSPLYTGNPSPNPKVHGPEFCPHRCGGCEHGEHHWIESGYDPDEPIPDEERDPVELAVRNFDRDNGTDHGMAFYGCKHCPAWCEYDTFEDDEID